MLRNDSAQKLTGKWAINTGSALHQFSIDGIWQLNCHRLYLNEIQERIDQPEIALHPFARSRKCIVELEQLKHFFEQKGIENGIITIWHKDFYGRLIPFTTKDAPGMKPIFRLV